MNCPECNASLPDGRACKDLLNEIHIWESQNSELSALHFLIVASYNLQHPAQFTDEALAGLKALYVESLDKVWSNAETLKRARYQFASLEGSGRVLKKEEDRVVLPKVWRLTIADVSIPHGPEGAVSRVRSWANGIRQELES